MITVVTHHNADNMMTPGWTESPTGKTLLVTEASSMVKRLVAFHRTRTSRSVRQKSGHCTRIKRTPKISNPVGIVLSPSNSGAENKGLATDDMR